MLNTIRMLVLVFPLCAFSLCAPLVALDNPPVPGDGVWDNDAAAPVATRDDFSVKMLVKQGDSEHYYFFVLRRPTDPNDSSQFLDFDGAVDIDDHQYDWHTEVVPTSIRNLYVLKVPKVHALARCLLRPARE